ncbi:MAG: hypothetical protein ACYC4L_22060 [Chloroflexota bacterium]
MKRLFAALALLLALSTSSMPAFAKATQVPDAIWANGDLYATVGTPTHLPDNGNFDLLFTFPEGSGQRSISEAAPGTPGYNGGRWEVHQVTFTGGNLGFELTSYDQLLMYEDLGRLTISSTVANRFVCPLLPR